MRILTTAVFWGTLAARVAAAGEKPLYPRNATSEPSTTPATETEPGFGIQCNDGCPPDPTPDPCEGCGCP